MTKYDYQWYLPSRRRTNQLLAAQSKKAKGKILSDFCKLNDFPRVKFMREQGSPELIGGGGGVCVQVGCYLAVDPG